MPTLSKKEINKLPIISIQKYKKIYAKIEDACPRHLCNIQQMPYKGIIICRIQEMKTVRNYDYDLDKYIYHDETVGEALTFRIKSKYCL